MTVRGPADHDRENRLPGHSPVFNELRFPAKMSRETHQVVLRLGEKPGARNGLGSAAMPAELRCSRARSRRNAFNVVSGCERSLRHLPYQVRGCMQVCYSYGDLYCTYHTALINQTFEKTLIVQVDVCNLRGAARRSAARPVGSPLPGVGCGQRSSQAAKRTAHAR